MEKKKAPEHKYFVTFFESRNNKNYGRKEEFGEINKKLNQLLICLSLRNNLALNWKVISIQSSAKCTQCTKASSNSLKTISQSADA